MQREASRLAAEAAGGEEASCTIAVLGNSYEGRGGEVRYGHQSDADLSPWGPHGSVLRWLAIATLFITCSSASGGQGSLQKGSRASSHAGDVTCLVRVPPLLNSCFCTSASKPPVSVCLFRQFVSAGVCQQEELLRRLERSEAVCRGCLCHSKEYIACACCAVYVYISYLPAWMHVYVCTAARSGRVAVLCIAWLARSLAWLRREIKRAGLVVCRVVSAGCCCCVTGTVPLFRDIGRSVVLVGWEWEIWKRDGALVQESVGDDNSWG
jgi:hypothetical protein